MANILIVEDDRLINNLIRKSLEVVGHHCVSVLDGEAVFAELEKQEFDLIILDVMLPKLDGFQVIQRLSGETPVIFLTAKGAIHDRVRGLKLGADDYLVKPFDMLELQLRIDTVLRRTMKSENIFELKDAKIELDSRRVYYQGQLLDFTPQEYLLIETLIKNRNIAMSREKLLEIAWGYDFVGDTRTVDVHIHSIRKKLGWEKAIKTVYKLGYRLETTP